MERHCENSKKVAEYLQKHEKVSWVRYPGLPSDPQYKKAQKYLKGKGGGMVVFGIKTDDAIASGKQFIDSLKLFSHVANVGDAKSLAIHPASTTHSQMNAEQQVAAGCAPEMVRLSIGIETCVDIIADLDQALTNVKQALTNVKQASASEKFIEPVSCCEISWFTQFESLDEGRQLLDNCTKKNTIQIFEL